MKVITANNVNDAFKKAVHIMLESDEWIELAPRGKEITREYATPVATVYDSPWRRVLFSAVRDANPFFHLMEALWMMAGRDDADWISQFNGNIRNYAEDNGKFHGAYGFRWRGHFRTDQITAVIKLLRREPESRRAVIAMWDVIPDLNASRRDIPCNTHIYFKVRSGQLNMTVCCRSNDIIWGCYGANAVHFSILQEYIAAALEVKIGDYTQISDSWHYYVENPTWLKLKNGEKLDDVDYYREGATPYRIASMAIVNHVEIWDKDLKTFFTDDWNDPTMLKDPFFLGTAWPMRDAYLNYRRGDYDTAIYLSSKLRMPDWSIACVKWLERRKENLK